MSRFNTFPIGKAGCASHVRMLVISTQLKTMRSRQIGSYPQVKIQEIFETIV